MVLRCSLKPLLAENKAEAMSVMPFLSVRLHAEHLTGINSFILTTVLS